MKFYYFLAGLGFFFLLAGLSLYFYTSKSFEAAQLGEIDRKPGFDEEKLFNLLVGWRWRLLGNTLLNDTIGIYDEFTGKIAKERLEQYSKKYNIPLDVIAAILIDYEAMHCNDL